MSAQAGNEGEFIDSQFTNLENITDALIYRQTLNWRFGDSAPLAVVHQRTDSVQEKLYDLNMINIEGTITGTTPELSSLMALRVQTNNQMPIKTWKVNMTDVSSGTRSYQITGQLRILDTIDLGRGLIQLNVVIEATTDLVTVA